MVKFRIICKIKDQRAEHYEGYAMPDKLPIQGKRFRLRKKIYLAEKTDYVLENGKVVFVILTSVESNSNDRRRETKVNRTS